MAQEKFTPSATITVAASTTAATFALPGAGDSVLIYNATSAIAFVSFGGAAATAASSFPIPAGARALIGVGGVATSGSVILASGSGSVYVSQGLGSNY